MCGLVCIMSTRPERSGFVVASYTISNHQASEKKHTLKLCRLFFKLAHLICPEFWTYLITSAGTRLALLLFAPLIRQLHAGLENFRPLSFVGDVRYIGLVGAIELVRDKKTKKPFEIAERIGQWVFQEGIKANLILRPLGNVIYLCPPLSITKADLDEILKRMFKIIDSLCCCPRLW